MNIIDINTRIKSEVCFNTIKILSDKNLLEEYKLCQSLKNKINSLSSILQKYVNDDICQKIINQYLPELIPAGTKGVVRGLKFNKIVKNFINSIGLDQNRFKICFEEKHKDYDTDEIPDWYILDNTTNRIIIGMNQLDLWNGGQQLNRGAKYLLNNKLNTENSKFLCVVLNDVNIKTKNKIYKIFCCGFSNDTLCYISNLKNIIYKFFNLNKN